jgi:hypothetical protein
MSQFKKREEIILAKYVQAESVREVHRAIKNTREMMKVQPRVKMFSISKQQLELEDRLANEWEKREKLKRKNQRRNRLQSVDNIMELQRKIRKKVEVQDMKFIRNVKPDRPKLEPLPYLNRTPTNKRSDSRLIAKLSRGRFLSISIID